MDTEPRQPGAERYRFVRELGRGAMGGVWLAYDEVLRREVALKALRQGAGEDASLEREALVLAALHHPNIVAIYDLVEIAGERYLVIEYIAGRSLAEVIAEDGPLSESLARKIGVDVAAALAYAHARHITHNDIKPANILIDEAGETRVTDFGIAHSTRATLSPAQARELMGTLEYLAPEVIEGAEPDARSDLYALAVTLYEAVAGRLPFSGSAAVSVARRLESAPPPLRTYAPNISPEFEGLIASALSPRPEERFASADELGAALQRRPPTRRIATGAAAGLAVAFDAPARSTGSRRRWPIAVGGVLGGLGMVAAGGLFWAQNGGSSTDPDGQSPSAVAAVATHTPSPSPTATATPTPTARATPTRVRPTPSPTATERPAKKPPGKENKDRALKWPDWLDWLGLN